MPYDSQGTFTRVMNWEQDRINDIEIVSDRHDAEDDNFANGFNLAFCRDGRSVATGNFKMGNFKITGMANGASSNDAVNKSQLDGVSASVTTLDGEVVKLAGAQTVTGDKTFSGDSSFTGSASFTGTTTVPTVAASDNSTNAASTAFVKSKIETGLGFPSYSSFTDISTGYEATENCWVFISFYHAGDGANTLTVAVNGNTIGGYQSHDYDNQNIIMPLKKGDTITFTGASIRFAKVCGMAY
jgi:hypothetical protein